MRSKIRNSSGNKEQSLIRESSEEYAIIQPKERVESNKTERVKFMAGEKQEPNKSDSDKNKAYSVGTKRTNGSSQPNSSVMGYSNKNIRNYSLKNDSGSSSLPFFLQHREVIQKQLRVEATNDQINQSLNSVEQLQQQLPPCCALYPPSSRFSTLSKRFPYDPAHRATTSVQEVRKKILAADDFPAIKSLLFPLKYSNFFQSQDSQDQRASQTKNQINVSNKNIPSPPPSLANSPNDVKKDIDFKSSTGMSPILQQLKVNSSALNQRLASNQEPTTTVTKAVTVVADTANKPQSPHAIINPSILKSTTSVTASKFKLSPLRGSSILLNTEHNNNNTNMKISHEAQAFMSDSFLQNEIKRWELKKQTYTRKQAKLKKAIDSKVQGILEEKGNKPPHLATMFMSDLKSVDAEFIQHSSYQTSEQRRYVERLRNLHAKKYSMFHSEVNLHTAQLSHPCHQDNHNVPKAFIA